MFGPALAPLAGPFALAVLARRWLFDKGWLTATHPGVPTISVGGLEVGGTGKTPVAGYVLGELLRRGLRPGLLTRGYGRPSSRLGTRLRGGPIDPALIGDEPAMLVAGGADVAVAACPDRRLGARTLVTQGCDCLVLYDGFSHRRLARDLDIVVLRAERPLGSGHLMPWGSLREPPSSLRRAGILWLHARSGRAPDEVLGSLIYHAPTAHVVVSVARPDAARNERGETIDVRGARVIAAAGIARPDEFASALGELGAKVEQLVRFRDHHRYGLRDVDELGRLALAARADAVAVTPKDHVKLAAVWRGPPLWVVGSRLEIVRGSDVVAGALSIMTARYKDLGR
jgi:tetraacyldisaccharide 4'-kinase